MPLVADIHFNYRYALEAIEAGADKIRINPGNIGSNQRVREVVRAADSAGIPIRVGVNSGSVDKDILEKYQGPTPQALAESALEYVKLMRECEFDNTVISIKASDVMTTVEACRIFSEQSDIPQHIGITESGTVKSGSIRSSVGLGILLSEGIGDTLRVSLSGDPVEEIHTAREILASLDLIQKPVVIACPTCGRTRVDVPALAQDVERYLSGVSLPIKVAVMGCIVNGPGEAKEADIGVACAPDRGMIFSKGERIESVPADMLLERLKFYIEDRIKSSNPL